LLFLPGVGQGLMYDADGDFDAGGDGADGFPALAAGEESGPRRAPFPQDSPAGYQR
jgi:hypothetical protein